MLVFSMVDLTRPTPAYHVIVIKKPAQYISLLVVKIKLNDVRLMMHSYTVAIFTVNDCSEVIDVTQITQTQNGCIVNPLGRTNPLTPTATIQEQL